MSNTMVFDIEKNSSFSVLESLFRVLLVLLPLTHIIDESYFLLHTRFLIVSIIVLGFIWALLPVINYKVKNIYYSYNLPLVSIHNEKELIQNIQETVEEQTMAKEMSKEQVAKVYVQEKSKDYYKLFTPVMEEIEKIIGEANDDEQQLMAIYLCTDIINGFTDEKIRMKVVDALKQGIKT